MIWLLTRTVVWPVQAAWFSLGAGFKTGRFFGYRRLTVLLVGVAIGLLVAPFPGKDLRALIKLKLQPPAPIPLPPAPDVDLTEPAGV